MVGETQRPDQQRANAEFKQHVAGIRDISVQELHTTFEVEDISALASFQEKQDTDSIVTPEGIQALSPEFRDKYKDTADILTDNSKVYDEEIEDWLIEDRTICGLIRLSGANPKNIAIKDALRARRSTLVYQYSLGNINSEDSSG